jgi:3'(2'), 5'-bisphosphate nucleotidase
MLGCALNAAYAAGEEILKVYTSGKINVNDKVDGSPVTDADLRAHVVISQLLKSTGFPVLSEESIVLFEDRERWQSFWLVDPLDGTKDFIDGNDEFTVNIAFIKNGTPVIGVISAPALNRTWYSSIGSGAWHVHQGKTSPINALAPWPAESRMFISRFHDAPESMAFGCMNNVVHYIPAGSALKLAKIASSEAEFYPRFAGTFEWDIAAGDAIIREAQGLMLTIHGDLPKYNKPNLRNSFLVAWRPPLRWDNIKIPEHCNKYNKTI